MIYAYRISENMTVIVASNDLEEYRDTFKLLSGDIDHASNASVISPLDMMMNPEYSDFEQPVMEVEHVSKEDQDNFFEKYTIKEIDRVLVSSVQEKMKNTTSKKEAANDLAKEKLKAEISGEAYVSPSIEETLGLNIYDPWDTRTEDEKKGKYIRLDDDTVMNETAFGDADTQRRARDQARKDANPDYVPMRTIGASKTEEDNDFNLVIQAKSLESKKLEGKLTEEEVQEELNKELDDQEKVIKEYNGPVYLNSESQNEILEEMKSDYADNLEYSSRKNTSFRASQSVKVEVKSLQPVIQKKLEELCNKASNPIPSYIEEYWYSPASIIDGYYILPVDETGYQISSASNLDSSNTINISINGPTTTLSKKLNREKDSEILFAKLTESENKKLYTFFILRLK